MRPDTHTPSARWEKARPPLCGMAEGIRNESGRVTSRRLSRLFRSDDCGRSVGPRARGARRGERGRQTDGQIAISSRSGMEAKSITRPDIQEAPESAGEIPRRLLLGIASTWSPFSLPLFSYSGMSSFFQSTVSISSSCPRPVLFSVAYNKNYLGNTT